MIVFCRKCLQERSQWILLKERTPRWPWAYNLQVWEKPDIAAKEQAMYLEGKEEKRVRASEKSLSLSFGWDKQELDDGTYSWRFDETDFCRLRRWAECQDHG